MLQDEVGFADELHVAVFDPVVDHLHVVTRTAQADPFAAGDIGVGADLGADLLEDLFDVRPGIDIATGHDAGAFEGTLFAAGNPGTDEAEAFGFDFDDAAVRIGEVAVAAVDEDVARREQGVELAHQVVDGGAGLDHHHDLARGLERGDQIFEGMAADELFARIGGHELVGLGGRAVEDRDRVAPALHVEHEVLTHHRQTHQPNVARCHVCVVPQEKTSTPPRETQFDAGGRLSTSRNGDGIGRRFPAHGPKVVFHRSRERT